MKRVTQALYVLVGVLAVVAGAIGVVSPGLVLGEAGASGLASHLAREEGAAFVFIGCMAFWCVRHFEARRPVHYAFVLLTGLFAGIHWAGYLSSGDYIAAAIVNTIPFVAFAATLPQVTTAGR